MKAILVDDEPLVLIGMQSMLNWAELGVNLVGTARNGADAWKLIQAEQPDLVICDIMMPVMNGIELLERCRKEYGNLPLFIVLTGYEEFSYVQRCIRLGVLEYLVKVEFTADDLRAALIRAKEQLQREHRLREPETAAAANGLTQYRDRLLIRLFNGNYEDEATLASHCAMYGLHFTAPSYAAVYAELENKHLPTEQQATLSACVANMCSDVLARYLPGSLVTGLDLWHLAVLIPLSAEPEDCESLEPVLRQTGTILFQYFNAKLRWAIGFPVANVLDIKKSLRIASSLLTQMDGEQEVCCYRADASSPMSYRAQLVARIQEYIRGNLNKKLTLNDVAAVFNFSPNYLSQLLSNSGEGSFVEFVTATRIDAAKELMAATDMKIYEISEKLGFETASYFSKVFKRQEGVSPREYMQMLGK